MPFNLVLTDNVNQLNQADMSFLPQPSGQGTDQDKENPHFFSVPAYLTVSGQLHLEVMSGWGPYTAIATNTNMSHYIYYLYPTKLHLNVHCSQNSPYITLLLKGFPQSLHIWADFPSRELSEQTSPGWVLHGGGWDLIHQIFSGPHEGKSMAHRWSLILGCWGQLGLLVPD